jgi:hypothetical protein
MISVSSGNAFADDSQLTTTSQQGFIPVTTLFRIPLSTEEDQIEVEGEEEDEQNEQKSSENAAPFPSVPQLPPSLRIAFVKPSFTYAAYQLNGFYNFYQKAKDLPDDTTNVTTTTDLNLLTVKVPDGPYLTYRDNPTDTPRNPSQQNYYEKLKELVEDKADSENLAIDITDITDKEVHEGAIFDSAGNNIKQNMII